MALTVGLPKRDRLYLACAQQNGVTALSLGLLLEPLHPGTIAIVAPALAVVGAIHFGANWLLDRQLGASRT
jgi:hypothetical protein